MILTAKISINKGNDNIISNEKNHWIGKKIYCISINKQQNLFIFFSFFSVKHKKYVLLWTQYSGILLKKKIKNKKKTEKQWENMNVVDKCTLRAIQIRLQNFNINYN